VSQAFSSEKSEFDFDFGFNYSCCLIFAPIPFPTSPPNPEYSTMRRILSLCCLLYLSSQLVGEEPTLPKFKTQEIATDLTVGYAVLLEDLNGDGKLDIIVVDSARLISYENPTWKMRTILQGKTKPDNVCITALDIDGDKQLDLVVGAEWKPFNTKAGGTLQWLKRGKTLDEEWSIYPIGEEPTVHRVRTADLFGDGKKQIVLMPLMGRNSSAKGNWLDGRPVRTLAYPIPKDPIAGPWEPMVLDETLNVVHNFIPIPRDQGHDILAASYEGVSIIHFDGKNWSTKRHGEGNQANPKSNRGASEIKMGKLRSGNTFVATIEPWHGNQVVVYPTSEKGKDGLWKRIVIDEELRWGHAVWCADLDGDGDEELIIGIRDNPDAKKGDTFALKSGVRIYKSLDDKGTKWKREIIEDGGVAVEDLAAADLNGDGKIDLVAVGRATKNARIYWNQGK
jgi:hypothetical protein